MLEVEREVAMTVHDTADEHALHDEAVRHLKKRRDFYTHLVVYFLVNGFLVVIWAFTTMPGFFWPVFPIFGWGIGVVMNAWDVFGRSEIREEDIRREMERLSRHE
jgi:hypothetical protein